jgi:hypothetical protein
MSFHFAFMFVTEDANSSLHGEVIETTSVKCWVVAVRDYT